MKLYEKFHQSFELLRLSLGLIFVGIEIILLKENDFVYQQLLCPFIKKSFSNSLLLKSIPALIFIFLIIAFIFLISVPRRRDIFPLSVTMLKAIRVASIISFSLLSVIEINLILCEPSTLIKALIPLIAGFSLIALVCNTFTKIYPHIKNSNV